MAVEWLTGDKDFSESSPLWLNSVDDPDIRWLEIIRNFEPFSVKTSSEIKNYSDVSRYSMYRAHSFIRYFYTNFFMYYLKKQNLGDKCDKCASDLES